MVSASPAPHMNSSEVLYQWSARKMRPIVPVSVAVVFVLMMALAHFVVHSPDAVKALAIAAVGILVPLVPVLFTRMEYRLSVRSLQGRPVRMQQSAEFETLFELDQLDYVKPIGHGFKFFKNQGEATGARRFFSKHLSDKYSGEVHVEKQDLDTVLGLLAQHGVCSR